MNWAVIKDNYVIDYIIWDGVSSYTYPFPYDYLKQDNNNIAAIGDWYNEVTDTYYRPVSKGADYIEE